MATAISMNQALIEKLTKILEANLDKEHFGVKNLAKEAGLSRSQLHRKLKSLIHKSPSRFIREFRLEKAMEMLQNNEATASEIAYRVGFNSPTYFNTCFHDYYGYPPGEVKYRMVNDSLGPTDTLQKELNQVSATYKKVKAAKKGRFNRRMVWVNTIGILLLSFISYSLYQKYKEYSNNEMANFNSDKKSIAIIPFKNLSEHKENQYFTEGVTNSIQNKLSKLSDLKIIPLASMQKYKTSDLTATEIAKEVNVAYLLEGSVQKHGDSIRIIASLINAKYNEQLRSFVFDWEYKNIFEIQNKIAIEVSKELDLTFSPEEIESIQIPPTKNMEAYNYWLIANHEAGKNNNDSFKNAVEFYELAITTDSTFAKAYFNYGCLWLWSGAIWGTNSQMEAWQNAKNLFEKAVYFDKSLSELVGERLLDGYYIYEWDFKRMEKNYQKSSVKIGYLIQIGRYEESLEEINRRIQSTPKNGFWHSYKAQALFYLDRHEEAKKYLQLNDEIYIESMNYLREAAKIYFYMEDYDSSRACIKQIMEQFQARPPIVIWFNAIFEQMDGNVSESNKYLENLNKLYNDNEAGSPAWFLALYYCIKEDYNKTFEWLQKSLERHEIEMLWLREEPVLKPLRNDPRYLKLYKKVGFPMKPHTTSK